MSSSHRDVRTTRSRFRCLVSSVILDEDLLRLVFAFCPLRDLKAASAVCAAWAHIAKEAFSEWRCRPGLYLVGGCSDGIHPANATAVKSVFKYDACADKWIPCAALLRARDHLGLVGWQGRLHALGGWSGSRNRASCETYTPRDDVWHMAQQRLQTPRSGLACAVSEDGACFALAGWGGAHQGFLSSAEMLQAEAPPPPSRSPRALGGVRSLSSAGSEGSSSSCASGGSSGGGSPCEGADEADKQYAASLSLSKLVVPDTAGLHMARHCPAAATLGRFLYLTGGSGTPPDADTGPGAQPTASVERLDISRLNDGWQTSIAPMLIPRYRHALAALDGKLYACGGQRPDGRATESVERYDPRSDTWKAVAPMGRPRFSHAMAVFENMLYVVGGFAGGCWLSAVERYDPTCDEWEDLGELSTSIAAPGLAVC
jgi:hypothetical protein